MDKKTVSSSTDLEPRDVQYIADKFQWTASKSRVRGRKLQFTPKQTAEFGIIGRLKKFGMTIGNSMDWVENKNFKKQWDDLFDDNDILKNKSIIDGKKHVYFRIRNAEDVSLELVNPAKNNWSDENVLSINITEEVLLAAPKKS